MRSQRWAWTHRYAVPMFLASLLAVILSGSALVGVLVFIRESSGANDGDPGEECLVGSWRTTSESRETEEMTLRMQEGAPVTEFRDDGTASTDYGDGTVFTGTYLLLPVTVTVTGELRFRYEVDGDTVEYTDVISNDTATNVDVPAIDIDGPENVGVLLVTHDTQCDGDSLTLEAQTDAVNYTADFERDPTSTS